MNKKDQNVVDHDNFFNLFVIDNDIDIDIDIAMYTINISSYCSSFSLIFQFNG